MGDSQGEMTLVSSVNTNVKRYKKETSEESSVINGQIIVI